MMRLRNYAGAALSLWLGLQSVALAGAFPLQSIDFATRDTGEVGITLNTGSIVPYHKVLVSENKLVLDIDDVSSEDRVHTNFSGAPNISHVIIQPLSKDKIRLIIRGEDLESFQVGFSNGARGLSSDVSNADGAWLENAHAALGDLQDAGMQSAVLTPGDQENAAIKPVSHNPTPRRSELLDDTSAEAPAADDLFAPVDSGEKAGTPSAIAAPVKSEPLSEVGFLEEPAADATEPGTPNLLGNLLPGGINADLLLKGGLLASLFLGLALFMGFKMRRIAKTSRTLEDMLVENDRAQAPKAGFREMADAYRRERAQEDNYETYSEPELKAAPVEAPLKSGASRPNAPIGLGSLRRQSVTPSPEPMPLGTPAPAKQAISQYQRQQGVKPAAPRQTPQPVPKRSAADTRLLDELVRARENQQQIRSQHAQASTRAQAPQATQPSRQPVNQAKAAQEKISLPNWPQVSKKPAAAKATPPVQPAVKRPVQQGSPLPDNPEVLNFLRNVAELMEKDGKANLSRSIQKNLNPS